MEIKCLLIGYIYDISYLLVITVQRTAKKGEYKTIYYIDNFIFDVPNDNKITDKLTNVAKVYISI